MRVRVLLLLLVVSLVAASAQAELALWYNFEEGTIGEDATTVPDQSSNSNDGQTEDIWEYGLPKYVTSHDSSKALLFGYDSTMTTPGGGWNNISVPKSESINHIGQQWSMGAWIRVDDVAGYGGTYGNYPRILSCPNYEIELHAPGDDASYFWPWNESPEWPDSTSWDMTTADTAGYEDTWMHMIFTYDGTTFTQYIDGSPVYTRSGFAHDFNDGTWDLDWAYWTDDPLKIGKGASTDSYGWFIGALDDVAIWENCYLDADGVSDLYNGYETPGTVGTVPEPMTIILFGIGGLFLRKRR